VGKHRSRWEDDVWRETIDLLQARKSKAAARNKESSRMEIGEAMPRKMGRSTIGVEGIHSFP